MERDIDALKGNFQMEHRRIVPGHKITGFQNVKETTMDGKAKVRFAYVLDGINESPREIHLVWEDDNWKIERHETLFWQQMDGIFDPFQK